MKAIKYTLILVSISFLVACDGGGGSSGNLIDSDGRDPAPLLADNGLDNFTAAADDTSFPKNINPDIASGFNVSLFSPATGATYDQYRFPVNLTSGIYEISYDFMAAGLNGSPLGFRVFFDTPQARSFDISNDSFVGSSLPYEDNTFYEVKHEFDLDNGSWVITVNGIEVRNSLFGPGQINNIRLSLGLIGNTYDPDIRLDVQNFTVREIGSQNL